MLNVCWLESRPGGRVPRLKLHWSHARQRLPPLKELLGDCSQPPAESTWNRSSTRAPILREQLAAALVDDCPLTLRDGGIIRPGYHAELDHYRELGGRGETVDRRVPGSGSRTDAVSRI